MTTATSAFAASLPGRLDGMLSSPDSLALESSTVHYYARSFGDPVSRLFWHGAGQDKELWMGMLPPYGRAFTDLLGSRVLDTLFADRLLAGLKPASQPCPGFEGVYRLDCTPRVITYWHEWSPKMWQHAALRLIELLHRLAGQRLTLRNPHPWNLLYDGRDFSYMNPGSVVPLDDVVFARAYEKVARFFLRPLLLVENGFAHTARRLAADPRDGVLQEDVRHIEVDWAEWQEHSAETSILPFLSRVASEVASFRCPTNGKHWIDYFERNCDFSPDASWSRKQRAVERMLEDSNIKSVLDLGANTGYYAHIAAQHGREAIAADFDPALVDAAFGESRKIGLSLHPAVLDFSHPTSAQGIDGAWFPSAAERFRSDLVLCFALVHHLIISKHRLDLEQVVRGIRSFAPQWALVEYVPQIRTRPLGVRIEADAWYSAENLAAALRRVFPAVEILPPAKDGRRLLSCGPTRRML